MSTTEKLIEINHESAYGPVRSASRSNASADALVADVVDGLKMGRYAPGQRLSEPDLMQRYGLSRGPVREALGRLHADGVVSLSKHRGATIRLFSRGEMIEVLELCEVMAGLAARLVVGRLGEGAVRASFEVVFVRLLQSEGDLGSLALMKARDDFFLQLVLLSGSAELARVFPLVHMRIMRLQLSEPALDIVRFDEYRAIGQAILEGDAARAELATRRHFQSAIELFRHVELMP